jgi:hypothetical protein
MAKKSKKKKVKVVKPPMVNKPKQKDPNAKGGK